MDTVTTYGFTWDANGTFSAGGAYWLAVGY